MNLELVQGTTSKYRIFQQLKVSSNYFELTSFKLVQAWFKVQGSEFAAYLLHPRGVTDQLFKVTSK